MTPLGFFVIAATAVPELHRRHTGQSSAGVVQSIFASAVIARREILIEAGWLASIVESHGLRFAGCGRAAAQHRGNGQGSDAHFACSFHGSIPFVFRVSGPRFRVSHDKNACRRANP